MVFPTSFFSVIVNYAWSRRIKYDPLTYYLLIIDQGSSKERYNQSKLFNLLNFSTPIYKPQNVNLKGLGNEKQINFDMHVITGPN